MLRLSRSAAVFVVMSAALAAAACAAAARHELNFNPAEPLRVMVLPFVELDQHGAIVERDASLFIDAVPLVSEKLVDTPPEFLRQLVYTELSGSSSLDLLAPYLVNVELPHYGFAKEDGRFDLPKIYAADPKQLCIDFLDCDAVLYGRITRWSRGYYGIESVSAVALELKLVSARTGDVLFEASGEDVERRGLSRGPTGFADLVLEPIKGLDSQIITDVSRRLVKSLIAPLNTPARPVTNPPPALYASTHDRADGMLPYGSSLTVLALGSEKGSAAFSIGSIVRNTPMIEIEPGHYFGQYHPLAADSFAGQEVTVTLTDQAGRTTSQLVNLPPLTLSGALLKSPRPPAR